MISLDKRATVQKKSRLDQDPRRLELLREHLGQVDRANKSEKTRNYLAPNSALLAKNGNGSSIKFYSFENTRNFLFNIDQELKHASRADKNFSRSVDDFLYNAQVQHPITHDYVIGLAPLSPEATKLCREDYHHTLNNKINDGKIPDRNNEFDFIIDSISANYHLLGKVLERGHNDLGNGSIGIHIFKPEISDIFMDMTEDLLDTAKANRKYKEEHASNIQRIINKVITRGIVPAGKRFRNPTRTVLEDIVVDNNFIRPINFSSRVDTPNSYDILNQELDLKVPLHRGIPVTVNGSGNNHAVISTHNQIGRGFSNPI